MDWLNYHHLLYFWMVAKEGGLAPAAKKLRLAHPTVSSQIHRLEDALGEKLFTKVGRRLALTEMGRVVYRYADEIFSLGQELLDTVRDRPTGQPLRLEVGIADALPKLVAHELIAPARQLERPVRVVCREGKPAWLLGQLALHTVDVVLSDQPMSAGSSVRAYNHLLGESGVSFFAAPALAKQLRRGFPRSLHEAPVLLPTDEASLRRSLDAYLSSHGLRPHIVGELEDSALLMTFGQHGAGAFPAPTVVERSVVKQYGVAVVGRLPQVRERYYAISIEKRIKHPAVLEIQRRARDQLRTPRERGGRGARLSP